MTFLSRERGARVSAVVLSYNSARYIESCVRAIAAQQAPDEPDELWVVENGSTDGSVEILRGLEPEFAGFLRVIYMDRNTGTTASRNRALQEARGRYVAIVDSDVTVPPGAFTRLIECLDRTPGCGLVAPKLVYPSGRYQLSTDQFPTLARKIRRFLGLKAMERSAEAAGPPTEPCFVDYAISAFWLLPREVVEKVGPLDERIFYSPEDVDYCLRIWNAGRSILYDPTVTAVHDAQEISRGFRLRRATFSHAFGLLYLFLKHRYAFGLRRLYRRIGREISAPPPRG
jgi:GT2 family glycosyltransferase